LKEQYATLCSKLRGYYQYFGVISNFKAIANAHYSTLRAWRYWLCVQLRLACLAGVSPAGVEVRAPVA